MEETRTIKHVADRSKIRKRNVSGGQEEPESKNKKLSVFDRIDGEPAENAKAGLTKNVFDLYRS